MLSHGEARVIIKMLTWNTGVKKMHVVCRTNFSWHVPYKCTYSHKSQWKDSICVVRNRTSNKIPIIHRLKTWGTCQYFWSSLWKLLGEMSRQWSLCSGVTIIDSLDGTKSLFGRESTKTEATLGLSPRVSPITGRPGFVFVSLLLSSQK